MSALVTVPTPVKIGFMAYSHFGRRRSHSDRAMALLLGRREGRDVIAAHTVLAHLGGDGKLELLFHEAAEEASYRMWLPTGLGDDVLDRDAGLPPKHLDDEILLALRRHYSPL